VLGNSRFVYVISETRRKLLHRVHQKQIFTYKQIFYVCRLLGTFDVFICLVLLQRINIIKAVLEFKVNCATHTVSASVVFETDKIFDAK
jgi:hypothetical protein